MGISNIENNKWQRRKYFVRQCFISNSFLLVYYLTTACKRSLGQGTVFTHVCLFTGGLCMMSLPVWSDVPPGKGGLCVWSHLPLGVSVQGGLCPGVSVWGSLSKGVSVQVGASVQGWVSVQGVSVREMSGIPPDRDPLWWRAGSTHPTGMLSVVRTLIWIWLV